MKYQVTITVYKKIKPFQYEKDIVELKEMSEFSYCKLLTLWNWIKPKAMKLKK